MTVHAAEGIDVLLEKNPIVPTFKARDLFNLPADVEAAYERHVRTYMTLSQTPGDDTADLEAFEHRLVRLVRDKKVPIGYVSAEYGHGKTSTGLFLWDSARKANVLAVPPFSLDRLDDIFTAVAGWVRFQIEKVRPGLGEEAEQIYQAHRAEGVDELARQHAARFNRPYTEVLAEFRELDQQGKLQAAVDGLTYVNFLEAMTSLAVRAGFIGLVVIADEVQQYIEGTDVSSAIEPIGKLFDVVTTMLTRVDRLACGLILLIPNKELGLLNQQRGDLVQRIKASRLALDLGQIYTPRFATDLWHRLADTFHFSDVADKVFDPATLTALGEIAARSDLASGPRTVIDVFKLACTRYQADARTPYGVLDLIHSFEAGEVAYDGLSRIRTAVSQALHHDLVRGKPEAERAVRLMAAFPSSGLSEVLQEQFSVRAVVSDLQRLATGELTAIRGGGFDHMGRAVESGVTLLALRPPQEQVTWLKGTIRDFRRGYFLANESVHRLAADGLEALLSSRLFPAPNWRLERKYEATALSQNQAIVLRGAFPSSARRFPERIVCCRILRPNERIRDLLTPYDILIDIQLEVPHEQTTAAQRSESGALHWLAGNHVRIDLNLLQRDENVSYFELNPGFEDIVAPYDVNPLLTLSLYAHLAGAVTMGAVPGSEESNVRDLFLPALHSAALRDLFTAELGHSGTPPVLAADVRFFEVLVQLLCERTYGDTYVTLMATPQWRKAIDEYRGALQKLDNPDVQSGNEPLSGRKKEVAELLTRNPVTLDNFIQSFPQLMKVEKAFRGDQPGMVRFTLHPLEQRIVQLVQAGERVPRLNPRTGVVMEVPTIGAAPVQQALSEVGYRLPEAEAGLALLEARRMIERDQRTGLLALSQPDVPSLDVVVSELQALRNRFAAMKPILSEGTRQIVERDIARLSGVLETEGRTTRANELLIAQRLIGQNSNLLDQELTRVRVTLQELCAEISTPVSFEAIVDPLTEVPSSDLFGAQLEVVRKALQKEAQSMQALTIHATTAAREVLASLSAPNQTDMHLVQASQTLRTAQRNRTQVQEQTVALHRSISDYRVVTQLLIQARDLLTNRLSEADSATVQQRTALLRWSADITGQLSAARMQALTESAAWQAGLNAIRQQLSQHEQKVRDAFNQRQDEIRGLLIGRFGVRADLLPAPLVYNPADPQESGRLLAEQMRVAIARSRAQFMGQVRSIATAARSRRSPDQLALLPALERARAESSMQDVERELQQIEQEAEPTFTSLIDSIGSAPISELLPCAQAIVAHAPRMAVLNERVQSITRLQQSVMLTPEEMQANALLLETGAGDGVDFSQFEQLLHAKLPHAEPWTMIRALVQKSKAQLHIQVIKE